MKVFGTRTLGNKSKSAEGEGGGAAPAATPPANGGTPPEPGGAPATPSSGLPSDVAAAGEVAKAFDIPADRIIDGKIDGKWESFEAMSTSYNDITKAYQREKSAQATEVQTAEQKAAEQATIKELTSDFREAGMQLTPEIEQKAVDAGIDIRDVKLTAMEVTQRLDAAHGVVGGKETYDQMIADMGETMTDAQKASFDADVTGGMSEYAIRGLHAQWIEQTGQASGQPRDRLRGNPPRTPGGVKGYSSQGEMMKDLNYINSAQGRNDTAAKKQYESRKNATSDSIVYGRP